MRRLGFSLVMAALAVASAVPTGVGQRPATSIVVTNRSDASNGDVTSVDALRADPGPDGISIAEAIEANNSDPGAYEISFARSLAGRTIRVARGGGLPALTGGGVTIDGDIDGDSRPDVTISSRRGRTLAWGFSIASSGNQLRSLRVRNFATGVQFGPIASPFPTHQTWTGNVVSGLVIGDVSEGIAIGSGYSRGCPGPPKLQTCRSHNTWSGTTIANNTVRPRRMPGVDDDPRGIRAFLTNIGDSFEHASVTGNTVWLRGRSPDVGIALSGGGESSKTRIADVLIARNQVGGSEGATAIDVNAGTNRAQEATVENVRIVDNRLVRLSHRRWNWAGIVVQAGSDSPGFAKGPPVRYLDDNVVRDVLIRGNRVTGDLEAGLSIQAAIGGGGRRNRVSDVRVVDNRFHTTLPRIGVLVWTGNDRPYRDRHAARNRISSLVIRSNRIRIGEGRGDRFAGSGAGASGVAVIGNRTPGFRNLVRDVRIARNRIKTDYFGVRLIGGLGPRARRNRVVCVRLRKNRVVGARTAVSIRPNLGGASRNVVRLGGC